MKSKKSIISLMDYEKIINQINLVVKNNNCTVKYTSNKDVFKAKISNGYTIKIFHIANHTDIYYCTDPNNDYYNYFDELRCVDHSTDIDLILKSIFYADGMTPASYENYLEQKVKDIKTNFKFDKDIFVYYEIIPAKIVFLNKEKEFDDIYNMNRIEIGALPLKLGWHWNIYEKSILKKRSNIFSTFDEAFQNLINLNLLNK